MIVFSPNPIPVVVKNEYDEEKDGYLLYVESSGQFDNDVWTIVHLEDGIVRHYTTKQVRISHNATFEIKK
jgi:hypothetical protein